MARVVPGSGAIIEPNFNDEFGVVSVDVISGGSGYSQSNPPRLVVDNCGTPEIEALLYPYIDSPSGRIVYVRVLASGKGYDPLRVVITAKQDSTTIVDSFDANKIWASANTSVTAGRFTQYDRLKITTNGLPDPAPYARPIVYAVPYNHSIIYRGGKDSPNISTRSSHNNKTLGVMANGVELHTPDAYNISSAISISNYSYDIVKTPTLLSADTYGGIATAEAPGKYFYTSFKLHTAFSAVASVFDIVKYYRDTNYQGDKSRHIDGHSKVLGYSYDGYPIYGPYGYLSPLVSSSATRMLSGYRLKTDLETAATRPSISTTGTVTYTVTVAQGILTPGGNRYYITGGAFSNAEKPVLSFQRGKKYVFNQDDQTNTTHPILFSPYGTSSAQGWHAPGRTVQNVNDLWTKGVKYYLENVEVSYTTYSTTFDSSTFRRVEIEVPVESPIQLYYFCYNHANMAERIVVDGYLNGTFIQDYIYDSTIAGALDEHNGRYCVTPEYPDGTYAYFATVRSDLTPEYPYFIGPKFYGQEYLPGDVLPAVNLDSPGGAKAEAIISPTGQVEYVNVKSNGDGYFGETRVEVIGGEGTGAVVNPVTQTVTGLSLISEGRNYDTPPNLFFQGGGGTGGRGVSYIDTGGKVTSITVNNPGQYYTTPPFIIIDGGGGIGARAKANISQGQVTSIDVVNSGIGYTTPPRVIFTKLTNLKRKVRNRQAFDSVNYQLTGLSAPVNVNQNIIYVENTNAFPGSGTLLIGDEIVRYSAKSFGRFTGLSRALNFRFDQRVILSDDQTDPVTGESTYQFRVGDTVIRRVTNSSNKIAKVYDWRPLTRELFVKFVVDDLSFIDAGIPSSEERIVAFDAGLADSTGSAQLPHITEVNSGSFIRLFVGDTVFGTKVIPQVVLTDTRYVDSDQDGIPNIINTATAFDNQISLDGGIYNSLYGIEETIGGTSTTLFQIGDGISDSSIPTKIATVDIAGALGDGVEHDADIIIQLDSRYTNNVGYFQGELVIGSESGIQGTVVSWNASTQKLHLTNIIPYDTGNVDKGVNGRYYSYSKNSSVIGVKVVNAGVNYTAVPTVTIQENPTGTRATAQAVMTSSGDQIASITLPIEGYGYKQSVDPVTRILYPTVTIVNGAGDITGTGAALETIVGGETIVGNNGGRWRVRDIEYLTLIRNE
jgi:hypothetical protein